MYLHCVFMFIDDAGLAAEAELKRPEDLTPDEKVALLGKPRLGEITRVQIRVKESKEFKVYTNMCLKFLYKYVKRIKNLYLDSLRLFIIVQIV